MMFRRRYAFLLNFPWRPRSSLRWAMTGSIPCSRSHSRSQSAEYALSPAIFAGCSGQAVASSNSGIACCVSCSWPGPTATAMGVPSPSQIRCNLVPKPPWLRPRAWSSGSPGGGFFFRRPSRRLVRPDDRAVDTEQLPVDLVGVHLAGLESPQDFVPQAGAAPLTEAVVDGLPGAELCGQVAPAAAVGEGPEDAVDHQAVVLPLTALVPVGRQEILDLFPLGIGQAVGRRSGGHGVTPGSVVRGGRCSFAANVIPIHQTRPRAAGPPYERGQS